MTTAVYSDIDIELSQANDGDILRDIDEDAILNSLINIVRTIQGSRRMLPDFAASIQRLLFEPIDEGTSNLIRARLMENIYKWDDRIIIEDFIITPLYDKNRYECLLSYKTKGFEYVGIKTINWVIRRD